MLQLKSSTIYILLLISVFLVLNNCEKKGIIDMKEIEMIPIVKVSEEVTFEMGSENYFESDGEIFDDQGPVHNVTLTLPCSLSKYEITNGQFCTVMNWAIEKGYAQILDGDLKDASGEVTYLGIKKTDMPPQEAIEIKNGILVINNIPKNVILFLKKYRKINLKATDMTFCNHPVNCVSWYGAIAFCNFLSEMKNLEPVYDFKSWKCDFTKNGFRLPTEAEWEYGARDHKKNKYAWGNEITENYCNFGGNKPLGVYTMPVGFYNGKTKYGIKTIDNSSTFGLYDMTGNVWEWCNDWYGKKYFSNSPENDPKGPENGDIRQLYDKMPGRVWRGGGNRAPAHSYLILSTRYSLKPEGTLNELGFRVAQTLK